MTAVEENSVPTRRQRRAQGVLALQKATEETTLMNKKPETTDAVPAKDIDDNSVHTEADVNQDEGSAQVEAGTDEVEELSVQPSTAPIPVTLPTAMLDIDDDFIDPDVSVASMDTDDTDATDDSESRFGGFDDEDFAEKALKDDLDPAIAMALRNRSIDEIQSEEDCDTEAAVLIAQQEELIRLDYFQAEIPEKVEQLRLEKEAAEKLERETALAKKKAIAVKAEHRLKARQAGIGAMVSCLLAVGCAVAFQLLGGL